MRTSSIIAAVLGMPLIISLTTGFSTIRRSFLSSTYHAKSSSSISSIGITAKDKWIEYMVEFRGVQSPFRLNEFQDSYDYVMKGADETKVEFKSVIADVLNPSIPVCAYVRLPNDAIATALTKRCCLIRSISQVWGDGDTIDEVRLITERNYDELVAPHFLGTSAEENSWRVDFRRYGRSGRSGLDPLGKKKVLTTFDSILKKMNGTVSLTDSKHSLIYLEDWSSYRPWVQNMETEMRLAAERAAANASSLPLSIEGRDGRALSSETGTDTESDTSDSSSIMGLITGTERGIERGETLASSSSISYPLKEINIAPPTGSFISSNILRKLDKNYVPSLGEVNHDDGTYVPLKSLFGRIIAEGPNIMSDFDLRRRPYLGESERWVRGKVMVRQW
jgi:hypothetical protein